MEGEEEGDHIPIAIHCHHQNDSCIKMGSDKSHLNVLLIISEMLTWLTIMEREGEGNHIPIAIHCHHQNDSCIKMGSDKSHLNV